MPQDFQRCKTKRKHFNKEFQQKVFKKVTQSNQSANGFTI